MPSQWGVVLNYYVLTRVRVCPYCGSRNLVVDYATGSLVCRDCGTVIDDTVVDYGPAGGRHGIVAGVARRFADKYLTMVDENRIADRYTGLRLHVSLQKRMALTSEAAKYISSLSPNDAYTLIGDKCVWSLISRLSESEKLVAIEAFRTLRMGEEPLPAMLASEFNVPRRRVKDIVKAVRACLGLPEPSQLL
jgi:ribosomal protein S27E